MTKYDATYQRSQLKGFTRLRAVLWRRSLRLWEAWSLRDRVWFAPLKRQMKREFKGLELDASERVERDSDIFGETPISTVLRLLEIAQAERPGHTKNFVDLGCGTGLCCLTAANLGYESLGLEQEDAWVQAAQRCAQALGVPCRFVAGDMMEKEWLKGGVLFVIGATFDEALKGEVLSRLCARDGPEVLIVGAWDLSAYFPTLWSGSLPVEWGVLPFAIYDAGPPLPLMT